MHGYQFTATIAGELVLLGVAVGIIGTLIGAGGGFILTPALRLPSRWGRSSVRHWARGCRRGSPELRFAASCRSSSR